MYGEYCLGNPLSYQELKMRKLNGHWIFFFFLPLTSMILDLSIK